MPSERHFAMVSKWAAPKWSPTFQPSVAQYGHWSSKHGRRAYRKECPVIHLETITWVCA